MTRPFTAAAPEPILFVSLTSCPANLAKSFGTFAHIGTTRVRLVKENARILHFCRLADYHGDRNRPDAPVS